jgi:hypothetical protein
MATTIKNYKFDTASGSVTTCFGHPLDFLTDVEKENLDEIGYTDKLNNIRTSRVEYLNSLNKGQFSITQTKWDKGDFNESFVLSRVYDEPITG